MKKFDVVFPTVRRVKRSLFRLNALIAKIISFLLEGAVIHKKWNFNESYMIQNHGDVFLPPSQLLVDPKHTVNISQRTIESLMIFGDAVYSIEIVSFCSTFWFLDQFSGRVRSSIRFNVLVVRLVL